MHGRNVDAHLVVEETARLLAVDLSEAVGIPIVVKAGDMSNPVARSKILGKSYEVVMGALMSRQLRKLPRTLFRMIPGHIA